MMPSKPGETIIDLEAIRDQKPRLEYLASDEAGGDAQRIAEM